MKRASALPGDRPVIIGCIHSGPERSVIELGFELNKEDYPLVVNFGSRGDWKKGWLDMMKEEVDSMLDYYGPPIGFVSLHGCYSTIKGTIALSLDEGIKNIDEWARLGEHHLTDVKSVYKKMRRNKDIDGDCNLTEKGKRFLEEMKEEKRTKIEPYYFEVGTLHGKSADDAILSNIIENIKEYEDIVPPDRCRFNDYFAGGAEIKRFHKDYGDDLQIL